MERKRVIDTSLHQVSEFTSINSFLATETLRPGIQTIYDDTIPIDILVSPHNPVSETTICFFHGAIDSDYQLPVLSGMSISRDVAVNRVFVSDPSLILDDTLMLAWYAGNFMQPDLQQKFTKILKKILAALGSKRVIFFGGSGGGFASLFYATQFSGSTALVFNPQTDIAKYSLQAVQDFVSKSFLEVADPADPLSNIPTTVTTNLCELYGQSFSGRIIYIQNLNDSSHVEEHLIPFLTSLHRDSNLYLLDQRWGTGHSPPPKATLANVIKTLVDDPCASHSLVSSGFSRLGVNANRAEVVHRLQTTGTSSD